MKILKNKLLQMLLLTTFVGVGLASCGAIVNALGDSIGSGENTGTGGHTGSPERIGSGEKLTFDIPTWLVGNWRDNENGDNDYTFTTNDIIDNTDQKMFSASDPWTSKKTNEVTDGEKYHVTIVDSAHLPGKNTSFSYKFIKTPAGLRYELTIDDHPFIPETLTNYTK